MTSGPALLAAAKRFQRVGRQNLSLFSPPPACQARRKELKAKRNEMKTRDKEKKIRRKGNENRESIYFDGLYPIQACAAPLNLNVGGSP